MKAKLPLIRKQLFFRSALRGALFVGGAVLLLAFLHKHLATSLVRQQLEQNRTVLSRFLRVSPQGTVEFAPGASPDAQFVLDRASTFLRVIDRNGRVVYKDRRLDLRGGIASGGAEDPGTLVERDVQPLRTVAGDPLLALSFPITDASGRTYLVQTAVAVDLLEGLTGKLWYSLVLVGIVLVAEGMWRSRRLLDRAISGVTGTVDSFIHQLGRGRIPQRMGNGEEEAVDHLTEELRFSVELVERSQETCRTFLSAVSHELAQPLTTLHGSLEMASDERRGPEDRQAWLGQALEQSERLVQLVRFLRELAEAENSGDIRKRSPLSALLEEVVTDMRPVAEFMGLKFQVQTASELYVSAHPQWLQQALVNLLSDAIHNSPAGGTVSVSLASAGREARLLVSSVGPEIPPEEWKHLFSPAGADKPEGGRMSANSFGLAIAKRVVEAVGGVLQAESSFGQGRTFTIRLPLALS